MGFGNFKIRSKNRYSAENSLHWKMCCWKVIIFPHVWLSSKYFIYTSWLKCALTLTVFFGSDDDLILLQICTQWNFYQFNYDNFFDSTAENKITNHILLWNKMDVFAELPWKLQLNPKPLLQYIAVWFRYKNSAHSLVTDRS